MKKNGIYKEKWITWRINEYKKIAICYQKFYSI